jgi:hypothetical protein
MNDFLLLRNASQKIMLWLPSKKTIVKFLEIIKTFSYLETPTWGSLNNLGPDYLTSAELMFLDFRCTHLYFACNNRYHEAEILSP